MLTGRARKKEYTLVMLLALVLLITAFLWSTDLIQTPAVYAAAVQELTLGQSSQGRPIMAVRFGTGSRKLVVVGDTHGGPEANTYILTTQLIDHFRADPGEVPASVSLYLIPTINPDGLALGSRFDANGVDLNRNMNTDLDDCSENDWSPHVQGAYGIESDTGGPYPESEVESRLIRDFLLDASGAIFLHSNAGLVFPAFCQHQPSIEMGMVYAQAAGYQYNRYWPNYMITGGMHDWAGSLGIAAIIPELVTGDSSEYAANLAGLQAVLAKADQLLPLPEDHYEAGLRVPALIWRFWKAHGGMARFGPPLTFAMQHDSFTEQVFERAILELHPDRVGTSDLVQLAPLMHVDTNHAFAPVTPDGVTQFFPETGHTLREIFQIYWQQNDGQQLFGPPISEEFEMLTADGQRRTVQYFKRAIFSYHAEDGSVHLEPVGWSALVREQLLAPTLAFQIR